MLRWVVAAGVWCGVMGRVQGTGQAKDAVGGLQQPQEASIGGSPLQCNPAVSVHHSSPPAPAAIHLCTVVPRWCLYQTLKLGSLRVTIQPCVSSSDASAALA